MKLKSYPPSTLERTVLLLFILYIAVLCKSGLIEIRIEQQQKGLKINECKEKKSLKIVIDN